MKENELILAAQRCKTSSCRGCPFSETTNKNCYSDLLDGLIDIINKKDN